MTSRLLLVAGCFAALGSPASAQVLELEGRYWPATLASTMRVTGAHGEVPADLATIDLKSDLGLRDKKLMDWRVTLSTGPRSRLRVAYVKMDYNADQDVQRTVVFNGQPFTVGTRVVTALRLDYWRCGWIWEFVGRPSSKVRFGTLIEAKTVSVDTSLSAPTLSPPIAEKKQLTGTLPTLGVVLDINPTRTVNVFAELSGIRRGNKGHALDGEAGVKLILGSHVVLDAGYRTFDLEITDDPNFAKLKNSGPYVGLGVRF
jgi:hypothetical protein